MDRLLEELQDLRMGDGVGWLADGREIHLS